MKLVKKNININELAKMNYQHKSLASGRWNNFNLFEQMANIGSEVERTMSWREKGNKIFSQKAFYRAFRFDYQRP